MPDFTEKKLLILTPTEFENKIAALTPTLRPANGKDAPLKEKVRNAAWRAAENIMNRIAGDKDESSHHLPELYLAVVTPGGKGKPDIYSRVFMGMIQKDDRGGQQLIIDHVLNATHDHDFTRSLGNETMTMPIKGREIPPYFREELLKWLDPLERPMNVNPAEMLTPTIIGAPLPVNPIHQR